jgi:hypothetical protein
MTNQLPPAGVRCSHYNSSHLSWVQREGGHTGIGGRINQILTMHMEDVSVEAHIVQVPDDAVVNAHFECRAIGINVAVQLQFIHMSATFISNQIRLAESERKRQRESYREEIRRDASGNIRVWHVDQLRIPNAVVANATRNLWILIGQVCNLRCHPGKVLLNIVQCEK